MRTCSEALQATTTHPVDIDVDNPAGLESAWTWSQAGQHQVRGLPGHFLIAALSALCSFARHGVLLARHFTGYALTQSASPLFQWRQVGLLSCHKSANAWQHMPCCRKCGFLQLLQQHLLL